VAIGLCPYAVGAFDLVRYNDTFLSEQWAAQVVAAQEAGVRGLFNYHWYKPAGLSDRDFDEIAAAANEQSHSDYASLQVISGAFQLIRTAAWLRFLSTPPRSSQTVTGRTNDLRIPRGEEPATATSPDIPFTGVISHAATLRQ
jgi:hypothetical protein